MTSRLYYTDSYQTEFESTIVDLTIDGSQVKLVLEASTFYPTSGGQPFDTGTLTIGDTGETLQVVDVNGEVDTPVVHLCEPTAASIQSTQASLQKGMRVRGSVDWLRRYDHMQQHSSQHLLSHTLDSLLGYETVSVHFGETESTIDVVNPKSAKSGEGKPDLLSPQQLIDIERYANEVVYRNLPITAYMVNEGELAKLPLRRPPKVTGQIRIVEISDLDYSACGGTHCKRSGELGPIKILKQERQRKNIRLTFVAGHRGVADYRLKHDIATEIASVFSNEVTQAPELARSLLEQNKVLDKKLGLLTRQMMRYRADELWQEGESIEASDDAPDADGSRRSVRLVAKLIDDLTPNDAKLLASILQEKPDAVVLLVLPGEEKLTAIFARGEGSAIHMGNLLRSTLSEFGGGGGGREDFAQGGGVPTTTAAALLAAAVAQVRSSAVAM